MGKKVFDCFKNMIKWCGFKVILKEFSEFYIKVFVSRQKISNKRDRFVYCGFVAFCILLLVRIFSFWSKTPESPSFNFQKPNFNSSALNSFPLM